MTNAAKALPNFPFFEVLAGLNTFQDGSTKVLKSTINGLGGIFTEKVIEKEHWKKKMSSKFPWLSRLIKNKVIGEDQRKKKFISRIIKSDEVKKERFRFDSSILESDHFLQPIFIVGFHHSGTRLIAQLLEKLDVFQIATSPTHEWRYIQMLNTLLLPQWNNPAKIKAFKPSKKYRVNRTVVGRRLWYNGYDANTVWGHKDPRTGAVLSAWLREFPRARVIHIVRDPLDVIGTLAPAYSRYTPGRSLPQQSVDFWSDLWETTIDKVHESVEKIGSDNFFELKFEDLCNKTRIMLESIAGKFRLRGVPSDIDSIITTSKIGIHQAWLSEGKLDHDAVNKIRLRLQAKRTSYGYD